MGLVQPRFQRQSEVSVGAVGKSLEWPVVAIVSGAATAADGGSGPLLGSIGSIRERIDVEGAPTAASSSFDSSCVAPGGNAAPDEGTKAGARGSGIPARPKMLMPASG